MSNPAVIKLVRCKIDGQPFYMDDNIGESIHIHLGNIRLDLTIEELHALCAELRSAINLLVDVEGFDCNTIDPVYMSLFLAPMLENLEKVAIDTADVSKLILAYEKWSYLHYTTVPHSRVVQALNGNPKVNDDHRRSHHIGQSSQQRVDAMVNSIGINGYPYDQKYIILYENQMRIRDGQHRASCIYFKNGAITIPVQRLYFKDKTIVDNQKSFLTQLAEKLRWKNIYNFIRRILRYLFRKQRQMRRRLFLFIHRKDISDMLRVYMQ